MPASDRLLLVWQLSVELGDGEASFAMNQDFVGLLYSQETEEGVNEANVGIAASLYISISNIGAAVLPVVFPFLFPDSLTNFIAITIGLLICLLIWGVVKRK